MVNRTPFGKYCKKTYIQLLSLDSNAKRIKKMFFGVADDEIQVQNSEDQDRENGAFRIGDGLCWSWAQKNSASTFQNVQDKHPWFCGRHCVSTMG